MKQGHLRGFGRPYLSGAVAPVEMPDAVVTLCKTEADAIGHSINFAKARFGYSQLDIAKLCGWRSDNHLSAYKRGVAPMPEKRRRSFAQVTGCALLAQYELRQQTLREASGQLTENERARAVLAAMLMAAA